MHPLLYGTHCYRRFTWRQGRLTTGTVVREGKSWMTGAPRVTLAEYTRRVAPRGRGELLDGTSVEWEELVCEAPDAPALEKALLGRGWYWEDGRFLDPFGEPTDYASPGDTFCTGVWRLGHHDTPVPERVRQFDRTSV